jgi:hypothetical protein
VAIARAQASVTATGAATTTITTAAFGSATTVGNVIVATGGCYTSGSGAVTITFSDSNTNVWVTNKVIQSTLNASNNAVAPAIGSTKLATAGAGHTVTITAAGATTPGLQLSATEFSGLSLTTDGTGFDGAVSFGASTSLSGAGIVATNPNDLHVGVFILDNNTATSGDATPLSLNGSTTGVVSIQSVTATTVLAIEASYNISTTTGTFTWSETYKSDATSAEGLVAAAFIATAPIITAVSTVVLRDGQTGIVITGSAFGASQGTGSVVISPTLDQTSGSAVTQTVTAWGDTSITITAVRSALALGTQLYLFVKDNGALVSNGWPVRFQFNPSLSWIKA